MQVHGKVTMVRPVCKITWDECTDVLAQLSAISYIVLCTVLVVIVFVFALTQRVRHPAVLWSAWVRAAPVVPPVGHHLLLPLTSSEFLWTVCKQFPVKLDFLSAWQFAQFIHRHVDCCQKKAKQRQQRARG